MRDENLMKKLAQVAEEETRDSYRRLDERWDRLSAGALTGDEEAALLALAESSEEGREAYEAFRPLDADFRARVVAALREQVSGGGAASRGRPAKVLPFPVWRVRRAGGFVAAAAALAAALALVVVRGPGELPALPEYVLTVEGGVATMRGEPPVEPVELVLGPGSQLELILRPRTAVEGEVAVRFFLGRGDEIREWDVDAQVAATGSIRLVGDIGRDLPVEPGEWTLWAAVGRPGALPEVEELRSRLDATAASGDWILLETDLRVTARP